MNEAATPYPVYPIDGIERHFACLPPRADYGGLPKFAASNAVIPRSQWREVDLSPLGVPVLDQSNHGSCVGHGSTTAFWFAYLQAGGTVPEGGFSPTSLYAQINGGRDAGAIVSDAMEALMRTGVGLMADVPESMIYDRQIPASAKAKYARFRVADAYHCSSFDEIGSALQLGFPVSFGITICRGFNAPGPNGLIEPGGWPIGGHCLACYGTTRLPDGRWVLRVRNSWNTRWGDGGNCLLPEGHFDRQTDAFAIRADVSDPQDANPAPVAP